MDAGPIDLGDVEFFAVERGQDLFDGFEEILGGDLANGPLVGPVGRIGDAVPAIEIPPGLDGSPGELDGPAVLIGEGDRAYRLIAGKVGVALGIFEGAEHPHSQIIAYAFHVAGETNPDDWRAA